MSLKILILPGVALRKESVDRNHNSIRRLLMSVVALRKESVDRNPPADTSSVKVSVALRKESVDRNSLNPQQGHLPQQSLSARRAWIEIQT